jgi:hypothetical protein
MGLVRKPPLYGEKKNVTLAVQKKETQEKIPPGFYAVLPLCPVKTASSSPSFAATVNRYPLPNQRCRGKIKIFF